MRRVLVITYYWPPAGGPGVQRWLKFVKYLPDFGIEPIVYIPENPHYPLVDDTFLDEVPEQVRIYKHPIIEPYGVANFFSSKKTKRISSGVIKNRDQSFLEKFMLWVRGNIFIPDARKFWVRPSVRFLSDIIDKETIETIITTGPPHSLHLIGLGLKEKKNIQWIADFRDPWTSIGYHKKLKLTNSSKKKHKRLESLVLNTADKVLVTSKTTKEEFGQLTSKPIKVITNGFEPKDLDEVQLDRNFTISHIGSMLTGRNPINLWQVLGQLVKENSEFKNVFKLNFIGIVGEDVLASVHRYGLKDYIEVVGYVSHKKALEYQRKAQVLLLAEIDSFETKGIIPGKLFEYMSAQRPILGVGPQGWEVAAMVSDTETGKVFDYQDRSELKNVILEWFKKYKENSLQVSSMNINSYSRRELTKKLAEYI